MDILIVITAMAAWVALQTWILPRLGVPTCCCAVPNPPPTADVQPEGTKNHHPR